MLGRIATSALAGPTPASACSASGLQAGVERQHQRVARRGLGTEQLARVALVRHRLDQDAGRAAQLVVVPRLEAGQPGGVAGVVLRVLLDDLRGHLADPPEQRSREVAGGRQRQGSGDDPGARDRGDAAADRRGELLAPEDDGLDERLGAGRLDRLHVRRDVDADQPGQGSGGPAGVAAVELGLVDADPGDLPLSDELLTARAEDVAPVGQDRRDAEVLTLLQRRLDHRGRPGHLPRVVDQLQVGLGVVLPRRGAEVPAPVQRCDRRRAGLPHAGGVDPQRGGAQLLGDPVVRRLRGGRGVGRERHLREVLRGQPRGQRRGSLLRVGLVGLLVAGATGAAGRTEDEGERESGGPRSKHADLCTGPPLTGPARLASSCHVHVHAVVDGPSRQLVIAAAQPPVRRAVRSGRRETPAAHPRPGPQRSR